MPCNNLNDFNSCLSVLIDKDFLSELKKYNYSEQNKLLKLFNDDFYNSFGDIIISIDKTFELRHIFCHEYGSNIVFGSEDAERLLSDCMSFLFHVDE